MKMEEKEEQVVAEKKHAASPPTKSVHKIGREFLLAQIINSVRNSVLWVNLGILVSTFVSGWSLWTGIDKITVNNPNLITSDNDKIIMKCAIVFLVVVMGGTVLASWHELFFIGQKYGEHVKKIKVQVGLAIFVLCFSEFAGRAAVFVDFAHPTQEQWMISIAVSVIMMVPMLIGSAMHLRIEHQEQEKDARANEERDRRRAQIIADKYDQVLATQVWALPNDDPETLVKLNDLAPGLRKDFRRGVRGVLQAQITEVKQLEGPRPPAEEDNITPIAEVKKKRGRRSNAEKARLKALEEQAIEGQFIETEVAR